MSGGVDSSIAAYLLKESGYKVEGIFMKNWEEDDKDNCTSKEDYEDAKRICKYLGIELNLVNFSDKYWTNVFEMFITELKKDTRLIQIFFAIERSNLNNIMITLGH